MTEKNQMKSARKKFMVMKTKQTILTLLSTDDSEIMEKLDKLHESLAKIFGDKDAAEIIESAIDGAELQFGSAMDRLLVENSKVKLKQLGENDG